MADNIIKGYPISVGGRQFSIIDHTGPVSYTGVTPGSPPTGGDSIPAAAFGMKFIEFADVEGSDDGTYSAIVFLPGANDAVPRTSIILEWVTAATGVQVGGIDLHLRHVRVKAYGG